MRETPVQGAPAHVRRSPRAAGHGPSICLVFLNPRYQPGLCSVSLHPRCSSNKKAKKTLRTKDLKKGNDWHFGLKAHTGVDAASGLVHTVIGAAATCPTCPKHTRCCMVTKRGNGRCRLPGRQKTRRESWEKCDLARRDEARKTEASDREQTRPHGGKAGTPEGKRPGKS